MAALRPPIKPWNSQSRGSSDGVSDRQKNSAPNATADEVEMHQAPRPHQQRMALLALVGCGDRFAGDVVGRNTHPNNPGSTPSDVLRSSSSDTVNWPCTSTASLPWSTTPMRVGGQSARLAHGPESALLGARDGDQHPPRGFGEET